MKKNILTFIATGFVAVLITSCNSPQQKVENAQEKLDETRVEAREDVSEAKENLNEVKEEANKDNQDWDSFETSANRQIDENKETIKLLKTYKRENRSDDYKDDAKYNKRIAELEQRNDELRKRIINYKKAEAKEKWEDFKAGFNKDIDKLGDDIKSIGKKDK